MEEDFDELEKMFQNSLNRKISSKQVPQKEQGNQYRQVNKMKFHDLPQTIEMYLCEIYPFGHKMFLTGIMQNGQTLNVVAADQFKQLYFVIKENDNMSEDYLIRAEDEIRSKLAEIGLKDSNSYFDEWVDRQYVFQIQQIPRERRKYFKVRYNFKTQLTRQIQPDWQGQTFKYVIGTTYTPLQLLIVNTELKGPCWIRIQKTNLAQNKSKNVQIGLCVDLVEFAESIQVIHTKTEPPSMRVLSFSVKQIMPYTINKRKYFPDGNKEDAQIYAISYHYCQDYRVNVKEHKPKLIHRTFYLQSLGNAPTNQFIACKNQKILLANFQAHINKYDPDFIVCHDVSKTLDAIICRLGKLDRNGGIKFSRLKTARELSRTNQVQRINAFLAGRLLVDTYVHAKDMVRLVQYDLKSLSEIVRKDRQFTQISDEEAKQFFNQEKPVVMVNKCRDESEFVFQMMNHFQIIQMTRSLSNICGNLWKRSLQNKRAQRNQFLIMHQCKKRDLIIPDKFRKQKGDDDQEQRKNKYQGGMVLEPKKGFYSNYILLLDFNSLYPSIIREYNVCFSMIERPKLTLDFYYKSKDKKKQKRSKAVIDEENPQTDGLQEMFKNAKSCSDRRQWGFLPILIDNIVAQRKKCKKKMKNANPSEYMVLDIQQKSYKIVANSIYGCLGFSISRFYSMPLAALITKKGRDSLMAAKEIVDKKTSVQVIYGDTDSLMISANNLQVQENASEIQTLKALKKVADELKKQINKQYTFLEIDIDGIFKPLILLMKKKYVANKLSNFEQLLIGLAKQPKFILQFKGVEIVRRDGCEIARKTLQKVIRILVETDQTQLDTRYSKIIQLFTNLKDTLKTLPISEFTFAKQLSKKLKQYANSDNLPHIKVANDRVKAGEKQQNLVNHPIHYVICLPKEDSNNGNGLAKNAYDPKAFERSGRLDPSKKLELDYDYYKSVIVGPVGGFLMNINPQIYTQICQAFQLPKSKAKPARQFNSVDDGPSYENDQEGFGKNLKSKKKSFKDIFGQTFKCLGCQNEFMCINLNNQKQIINLKCEKCGKNNVNLLYNKIRMEMKLAEIQYYDNRKRCMCTKMYQITNIVPCCELDKNAKQKKSEVAFKLHNSLYLVKDLFEISKSVIKQENRADSMNWQKIVKMINSFLNESQYEVISDVFSRLKL